MRVVQHRHGTGFGQIFLCRIDSIDKLMMGHFDRDTTIQLFVVREVDQSESTLAQDLLNLVATDPFDRRLNGLLDRRLVRRKDDRLDFRVSFGFRNVIHPPLSCSEQAFDLRS